MCVRSRVRQVSLLHGKQNGGRSQFEEDISFTRYEVASKAKGSLELERKSGSPELIYLKSHKYWPSLKHSKGPRSLSGWIGVSKHSGNWRSTWVNLLYCPNSLKGRHFMFTLLFHNMLLVPPWLRKGKSIMARILYKWLLDMETRYGEMEKLVLSLIVASRKLWPYFHAHKIKVLTNYPSWQVLQKPTHLDDLSNGLLR